MTHDTRKQVFSYSRLRRAVVRLSGKAAQPPSRPCGLGQVAGKPGEPGKPAARTGHSPALETRYVNQADALAPLPASATSIFTPGPIVELSEILRK